jgi:hypothetical protein
VSDFERVCQILDDAVGGPDAPVRFHGPFWRAKTRDEFVATTVFGRDLLVVGDSAGSTIVLALRGRSPFGADLPEPPEDALFERMPRGRDPVPEELIAFIERWIDGGCA